MAGTIRIVGARTTARESGGLEEEFVEEVVDALICHICTKPLRDPHLTKCCGHNFCESCLEMWSKRAHEQRCPFCRSAGDEFQHFLDKKTKREIDALKVRCTNKKKGCEWVGELGELKGHLTIESTGSTASIEYSRGCGYSEEECRNGCGAKVLRKFLPRHLKAECLHRQHKCKYCGFSDKFIEIKHHYKVCPEYLVYCPKRCNERIKRHLLPEHRMKCPLETVDCPFSEEGCTARNILRKDEAVHMERNVVSHQLLMHIAQKQREKERKRKDKEREESEKKREKRESLKVAAIAKNLDSLLVSCAEDQRLPLQSIRSLIDDSHCLKIGTSLVLSMTNFSKYKLQSGVWYSPPFYVEDFTGLKLRLAVYANGVGSGQHSRVSIVIQTLKSDLKAEHLSPVTCGSRICVYAMPDGTSACFSSPLCQTCHTGDVLSMEQFLEHERAKLLCVNDILKLCVKLVRGLCDCH